MSNPSDLNPMQQTHHENPYANQVFSGNIFIFHAFDIGEDTNLEKVKHARSLTKVPLALPKYFRNYHMPIAIELPHPHESSSFHNCKIHSFGAISLTYKIPFKDTLENVRREFTDLNNQFRAQSTADAKTVFKKIEPFTKQPRFYHTHSSYIIVQLDHVPDRLNVADIKKHLGPVITSMLRFETETLSEYQRKDILNDAIGYFKGDLIIIDTDVTFVYDSAYEEILDFFEFANIQQLELEYFDRILDQQLNRLYEEERRQVPLTAYLPLIGSGSNDPVSLLSKLKVDISVIIERLESSIKVSGDPYFTEVYGLLIEKLDLQNWQKSIDRKLSIIQDVRSFYQHRIDSNREDLLTVLIIILIFIELIVGLLK